MAWSDDLAAVVVVAAEGYPGAYAKGEAIGGLAEANAKAGVKVIHAGTALDAKPGDVLSAGGRVLGVVGTGASQSRCHRQGVRRSGRARVAGRFREEGYRMASHRAGREPTVMSETYKARAFRLRL